MTDTDNLTTREINLLRRIVESGSLSEISYDDFVSVTLLINAGLVYVRRTYVPTDRGIDAFRRMEKAND